MGEDAARGAETTAAMTVVTDVAIAVAAVAGTVVTVAVIHMATVAMVDVTATVMIIAVAQAKVTATTMITIVAEGVMMMTATEVNFVAKEARSATRRDELFDFLAVYIHWFWWGLSRSLTNL